MRRGGKRNLFGPVQTKDVIVAREIHDRGMQISVNGVWYTAIDQNGRVEFTPVYGLESSRMSIPTFAAACRTVHAVLDARRARIAAREQEPQREEGQKQQELF